MRSLCDFLYLISLPYPRERRVPDETRRSSRAPDKKTHWNESGGVKSSFYSGSSKDCRRWKTLLLRTHTENNLKCRIRKYRIMLLKGIMTVTSYGLAVFVQCRRMRIITVGIDTRGSSFASWWTYPVCTFVLSATCRTTCGGMHPACAVNEWEAGGEDKARANRRPGPHVPCPFAAVQLLFQSFSTPPTYSL